MILRISPNDTWFGNAMKRGPGLIPRPGEPLPPPDEPARFRYPWEDEPADEMPGPDHLPRGRPDPAGPAWQSATLLLPLAQASAALARLDARLDRAAPELAEGLRARIALREAAGWLAHQHGTWVHPTDLGLREAGLTGSITAASMSGRLRQALPASTAAGAPDAVAEDAAVALALQLGRWWQRLAGHRTWSPLADASSLRQLVSELGSREPDELALTKWLAEFAGRPDAVQATIPALLRAGQAAQAWATCERTGNDRADRLPTAALFLAACLWRRHGTTPAIALPVWSAPPRQLDALALATGSAWLAGFLATVAEAAQRAGQELTRLQAAADRAAALRRTARSRLPDAAALALRSPVLTAAGLASRLRVSHQAALGLIRQLVTAGVLREATGRAAWRAFTVG